MAVNWSYKMKNFLKRKRRKDPESDETSARITNETVAEHREKVLAGGRKFKYPIQYQRHKLVINTIIIGVATVVLLTAIGWYQLYIARDSSELTYRITQLIPVRIASVDGEPVPYSDYLMRYRSSIFYAQKQGSINLNTSDGKRQAAYYQRQELTNAERNAYVTKLAHQQKLSVSDKEVNDFIKKDIDAKSVSLNAYEKTVLKSYYDWSLDEYRSIVRDELLKRRVSFAIDTKAKQKAESLRQSVISGADFATVAKESSDDETTKSGGGDSGVLPTSSLDSNDLIVTAMKLEKDQVSNLIQGVDGYYFIKLTSKSNDAVQYRVIKVKLTAFDTGFTNLQEHGKIKEYISVAQQ